MIKKILIANRGEIAVRIMRTCREMGITSVAVFSEADRRSMHVRYADEAYFIGSSSSSESYLVIDKIISAAKKAKADAIHPGYGFLSENAEFSDRCKKEGIVFIGPSAESIASMGDKITARRTIVKAGVPVVPGTTDPITSDDEAVKIIRSIGLPVMVKASAGGGGKGMRLIKDEKVIASSIRAAKSEAKAAFGNDAVYIEKYIESPHHIEFQILADRHGKVIHLFERECSVQRRHQKVIEETPSPLMTPKVRKEMGDHAVSVAKAAKYEGAGTIEFIVDNKLNYFFLEMNTRLQVEHPITERVTGIDLVREQINIANGLELAYEQNELSQNGHAIECRIYAEDPDNNFMPSPGLIQHITEPLGFGVRHDGYVYEGFEIPIYYDPLISKLIVWGKTRPEAIARMKRALHTYKITGVKTSIKFLERIMNAPDFVEGQYDTHFIEKNRSFLEEKESCVGDCKAMAIIAAFIDYHNRIAQTQQRVAEVKSGSEWKTKNRKKNLLRM
jgi:acetyl-CoA carboxylase biotin carboxylase subunit